MPNSSSEDVNRIDYLQRRKKEIEELLENERQLRHIVEIQIVKQGGENFAQPGLISQLEEHQKKIDELKSELTVLGKNQVSVPPSKGGRLDLFSISLDEDASSITTPKPFMDLVAIVVLFILFVAADIVLWQAGIFVTDIQEILEIDSNFHHLGDNLYSEEYMQSVAGDRIRNLSPEGLKYINTFTITNSKGNNLSSAEIKSASIHITVNHLKPRKSSPVTVFLNGHFIAYLNDYVEEEQFKRKQIAVPLEPQYLIMGNNEVLIQVEQDSIEGDYEDMEFNNLGIMIVYSGGKKNMLSFFFVVAIEVIVVIILIYFATRKRQLSRNYYG